MALFRTGIHVVRSNLGLGKKKHEDLSRYFCQRRRRKSDQEVGAQLREALHDGGAHDALARVGPERVRDFVRVGDRGELLGESVAVLGRLAASLAQVGHHWVRGVAADRDAVLGPRGPQPLWVERVQEGRAVVQVAALDVHLGRRVDEFEREPVPSAQTGRESQFGSDKGELAICLHRHIKFGYTYRVVHARGSFRRTRSRS